MEFRARRNCFHNLYLPAGLEIAANYLDVGFAAVMTTNFFIDKLSIMKIKPLIVYTAFVFIAIALLSAKTDIPDNVTSPTLAGQLSDSAFLATAGSMAMNNPDQFNWEIFARVCRPAAKQILIPNTNVKTNNAVWETWADDPLTYPSSPDPNNPPQFPTEKLFKFKKLVPSTQLSFHKKAVQPQISLLTIASDEEVCRNKASFDYIIQNDLWYKEGLADNFAKRTANGKYLPISFPTGAIEVKAKWTPIQESDKPNYHWNYDANGKLYGLTAFHIMTKAIPNWTWATWEWVGTKGRCDNMGCHDAFGVTPSDVQPHPGAVNQPSPTSTGTPYPGGTLTPALLDLFKQYGLGDEWKNYRLKGSQIDWIDATGRATLVGNSVMEDGFVATSSCITCHSVASFDANGNFNPTIGSTPDNQSQNGPINPGNFWENGKPVYLPSDFVWGLLAVKPVKK